VKKNSFKQKPDLTIIGAGRLGTALAIALSRQRFAIKTLVGRRLSKTRKSAALLDAPVEVLAAKKIAKLQPTQIIIIATPDDQIAKVAEELSKLNVASTVLHTSGALSSDVLSGLAKKGWHTGSIHPLISVSDSVSAADEFKGAYWCVEGSRPAIRVGKELISILGGKSFSISTSAKPLYHAAAVMTSGNVVALFDVAIEMLTTCGLNRPDARRILLPLFESNWSNLKRSDTSKALTGTFARGDLETVQRHLRALSQNNLKDAQKLYRLLGTRSLKLSEKNGLDPRVIKRITDKLTVDE
jgi:predicted short-subunit dehydrogenase-like oxidoreductase (DUF2520 family)